MKKLSLLIFGVLILTGCSNNTLVCNLEEENEGLNQTSKVELVYENDTIKQYDITVKMKSEDSSKEDIDTSVNSLIEFYDEEFKGIDGISYKVKNENNNTISMSITLDFTKIKEEDLDSAKSLSDIDRELKKADAQEYFEEKGFTCK